jgi:CRISPR type IV-associated protein Csf3
MQLTHSPAEATPVRVEFTLRTPMVVPTTGKHLDALLSWAAVMQADFQGSADPVAAQHAIGVARHQVDNHQWCFMASLLEIDWLGEPDQLHYIKRSKLSDFANAWDDGLFRKKPYFDGSRGSTKAGSYLQPIRWVSKIVGYAMVEDMERFKELLPWITHIGKLAHKDFGAVFAAQVIEDEQATAAWLQRSLPADSPLCTVRHVPAVGTLHSPYWKRENFQNVSMFLDT